MDNAEMNEDWTKTRSWDLYLGGKPVDTLKELLYIFGLQDSTLEVQQAKLRHFTELPSYLPAPQSLKDEIAIFLGGEILKGDILGHEFHGNQHTGGIDGGGSDSKGGGEGRQGDPGRNQVSPDRYKVSDGSSETPASPSKFIGDSAADFTMAGGKTFEVKAGMLGYHDADALSNLQKEVDEEAKSQGFKGLSDWNAPPKAETEKYQQWSGLYMMRVALDPFVVDNNREDHRGEVRVFVARDAEGKIAGAAQIQNNGYIHYIGSNNKVDGAGTALISNIIRNAADNGVGVAFEPLSTAVKFWETAGFKPKTEGSDTYVMQSAEVKQVAEELRGMKVQKGDLNGHEFHGNQFTDGQSQSSESELDRAEHINELQENLRQVSTEQERGNRLKADQHKLVAAWHFLRLLNSDDEVKKVKPKWTELLDEEARAHKNGDEDKANQIHYEVISALYDEQEVAKGDVVGHEFHGNQYSDVQASGDGWVLVPRGGKGGDAPKPREPKVTTLRIRPTAAVKPSAAAQALEPPKPPDAGSPQKIEPRGGFVALTSTDIVKKLGDKEALGGAQNSGFQRVLLADGTIGTLKTGVGEDDMRREMVAVTVAKALDLPTVESVPIKVAPGLGIKADGLGKWSLLMPWIEQDPDTVPREITRGLKSWAEARDTLRDLNPTEYDRAELLHALTGNPDDHMGNYMTTKDPVTDEIHIIPVDNAIRGGLYKSETKDAVEQLGLSTAEIQRMDAGIESILQTRANWCDQEAQRDLMEIHDSWKSILPDMLAKASRR